MPENKDVDVFIRLLANHQGHLYSYILSLVGNYNDSDDIFQETSSKLWELFEQYKSGTDFLRWSLSVAHYRVMEYRKKARRCQKIVYSDEFFNQLSDSAPEYLSKTREYLEKLNHCIEKLQPQDAAIVQMRYYNALPAGKIAVRINRSIRSVYLSLARIQHLLLKCIDEV